MPALLRITDWNSDIELGPKSATIRHCERRHDAPNSRASGKMIATANK